MSKPVTPPVIVSGHEPHQPSLRGYVTGFSLSVYLTVTAYVLVAYHLFSKTTLLISIFGMASLQFLVQIFYFLHLGRETKPRWKQMVFYFMLLVVGILVIGSIWIMTHLNYHMNTPTQIQNLPQQEGL